MNKISMDALNAGWSIGFGTRIHSQNADFDYALSRSDIAIPQTPRARRLAEMVAKYAARTEVLLVLLSRRLAH